MIFPLSPFRSLLTHEVSTAEGKSAPVKSRHQSITSCQNRQTENLRQLHAHEHPRHEEAEQNTDKANEQQQEAVEFGNVRSVGAVEDYEAQASHCKQEAGGQSFHDVLTIYSEQTHYLVRRVQTAIRTL